MNKKSIFSVFVALIFSLVLVACQTTNPWGSSRSTEAPPADLLEERDIFASQSTGDIWFAEDGSIITPDKFVDEIEITKEELPSVTIQSQEATEEGNIYDSFAKVQTYKRDDQLIQGRVIPYKAVKAAAPKVKVAILLPLSGEHKTIGKSILNAAQLAMFDVAGKYFELMPRDTKGTPEGAEQAAYSALQNGAQLILGPLFASSVEAIKPMARSQNVKIITFSTDWNLADRNTYVMGFLPFDQVYRVMSYAASQGLKKQAIIAPYTKYGDAVTEAFKRSGRHSDAQTVMTERYRVGDTNFNDLVRKFTRYDERTQNLETAIAEIEAVPARQRTRYQRNELARMKILSSMGDLPFDAIVLPMGGSEVRSITSMLKYYDVDLSNARFLGTGLWDDPAVTSEVSMIGGWYAAPSPQNRARFEEQYQSVYGSKAPRIASLGYDATALVSVLARKGFARDGRPAFDDYNLTNASGFAGVDGIFRFKSNGIVERGLAVLEITKKGPVVISPAPTTFQQQRF